MQATIRFLAVLIAFVALSPHSYSQTYGHVLEDLKSVKISVNSADLEDEDAKTCGRAVSVQRQRFPSPHHS